MPEVFSASLCRSEWCAVFVSILSKILEKIVGIRAEMVAESPSGWLKTPVLSAWSSGIRFPVFTPRDSLWAWFCHVLPASLHPLFTHLPQAIPWGASWLVLGPQPFVYRACTLMGDVLFGEKQWFWNETSKSFNPTLLFTVVFSKWLPFFEL